MEPKTEWMCLPQWDGDPSGWRDYQQEVRLHTTSENLEINWSLQRDWLADSKEQHGEYGLAMADQELLPTTRNIPDNGERKGDRNRRSIEALMTRLKTELGQQRPQKKGKSLEIFFCLEQNPEETGERIMSVNNLVFSSLFKFA